MKCTDARAALPLLIYGESSPHEQAALREHLAGCAACRREHEELQGVRRLLDAAPVPHVEVDLAQLHQTLTDRQASRLRRWRRAALALGAVAAGLLLVVGLRLEVRLEAGQMVVRWGEPPPSAPTPLPPQPLVHHADLPAEVEGELRVLRELIHALKQDGDDRDERFQERLDRLQTHVRLLQAQADRRWSATEQDVAALYLLTRKGENP
ncbi:MAG TPA: anti-sigma factor [Gemmataceae bacterium]|jgi:hypothetical protein